MCRESKIETYIPWSYFPLSYSRKGAGKDKDHTDRVFSIDIFICQPSIASPEACSTEREWHLDIFIEDFKPAFNALGFCSKESFHFCTNFDIRHVLAILWYALI